MYEYQVHFQVSYKIFFLLIAPQLEKERKTRAEVASIVETVRPALSLLSAAVAAMPQFFSSVISPVLEQLVAAFSSPAFAKQASFHKCYVTFTYIRLVYYLLLNFP